ncbi:MAG: SpoIIE family protein phosphatase [Candidatus Eremiobacterota bacterium]
MKVAVRAVASGRELQDRAEFLNRADHVLALVADGVSGQSGGAEAAQRVVEGVRAAALSGPAQCRALLVQLDRELLADSTAGQTTAVLVGASASGGELWGASVGDSGAWLLSSQGHRVLSQHSRKPYLGSGEATPVEFQAMWRDETLLVASDGLLRYTDPTRIVLAAATQDLEEAAERLLQLVRLPRSGELTDDTSFILVRRGGT